MLAVSRVKHYINKTIIVTFMVQFLNLTRVKHTSVVTINLRQVNSQQEVNPVVLK